MEHLIANSGIHFITQEVEINPSEPLILSSGKTLKYSFCEIEDFLDGSIIFDLLYYHKDDAVYIPLKELSCSNKLEKLPNHREDLDEAGIPKMIAGENSTLFTTFDDGASEVMNINNLNSYRLKSPKDGRTVISAFELLLDNWLPMPMYEKEIDGVTSDSPSGWCRLKIQRLGEGYKQGTHVYRLIWAFDTSLSTNPLTTVRPYFYDEDGDTKEYGLCNKVDSLFNFHFTNGENGIIDSPVTDYITALFGIDKTKPEFMNQPFKFKHIGYYIYFINYIRLLLGKDGPEIILHNKKESDINVDLVLDIGNSRTCGVLFEEGDFTKAMMLELRDLSSPWLSYDHPFDMRIVFRKADFGNDIIWADKEDNDLFCWKSVVRIGDEAKNLVYKSREEGGLSERTTNYSSPKRYLWDMKSYDGKWEFLTTIDDPFTVKVDDKIYIKGLTDLFDDDGTFNPKAGLRLASKESCRYSRGSLMTFVMVEILQHALVQINSVKFRTKHGKVDCRRSLRNIILTCPTAMPIEEQIRLRQSAVDAYAVLKNLNDDLKSVSISPSPESLKVKDDYDDNKRREWSYDEASSCQLVYLYAEIAQRYSGEIHKFIEMKGHVRPELKKEGYDKKSLTIGSIDIGAGTTDIMISTYKYEGEGRSRLTPIPQFWDSFYLAGDDILRNIVQNIVIDGQLKEQPDMGCIHSALECRLLKMTNEELIKHPSVSVSSVYQNKMDNIVRCIDDKEREYQIKAYASNLIRDYFGRDSNMMSFKDRQCRTDFNTQISVPIAQKMMDLLRLSRPSKLYTFDALFPDNRPSGYLLDHFARHFGFRFEELQWRYDSMEVSEIVKSTMEPLMKQLSIVLYAYHCDILVLAGRPTSIDTITELFVKYYPLSPDRLVRLNDYMVGSWYPFADGQGYFYDQKSVVAVGAMVGYLASHTGFNGLVLDFDRMIKNMKSTANYMGMYNSRRQQVSRSFLSPTKSNDSIDINVFPAFIGCKQFDSIVYQARPIYAIYNNSNKNTLRLSLSRNYQSEKEKLIIEEVSDSDGNTLPKSSVVLVQQSLVDDGKYWLDKGEFELSLK